MIHLVGGQWGFTAPFEGIVPHLYLDTRANVTCGVGFLVPDEATLVRLPWWPSIPDAIADYRTVKAAAPGHAASFYKPLCHARLSEANMRRLFDMHVTAFRKQLDPTWHLNQWPECAQVALVDMAFNLGVGGLAKYAHLRTAIFARRWDLAASECHRAGISDARNEAAKQLFLQALDVV